MISKYKKYEGSHAQAYSNQIAWKPVVIRKFLKAPGGKT